MKDKPSGKIVKLASNEQRFGTEKQEQVVRRKGFKSVGRQRKNTHWRWVMPPTNGGRKSTSVNRKNNGKLSRK